MEESYCVKDIDVIRNEDTFEKKTIDCFKILKNIPKKGFFRKTKFIIISTFVSVSTFQ